MQQKTKTFAGAIIVVVLIVALFGIYSVYHKKNNQPQSQSQQSQQVQSQTVAMPAVQQPTTTLSTKVDSGTITSITDQKLQVKTADTPIDLNVGDGTSIYTLAKGSVTSKTFTDLKVGQKVMFEYDEKTGNAVSVKIVSNQ